MYDAQILPILMYGSELWGFQQFAVTEKAHMFACKRFLNVSVQTPNKMSMVTWADILCLLQLLYDV